MRVTVNVTEENIRNGRRLQGSSCPVALALQDMGFKEPLVDSRIFWFSKQPNAIIKLSRRAQRFIADFDSYRGVAPFSFRPNIPADVVAAAKGEPQP